MKTRQVFYVLETSTHAGAYLVDAATGKMIWKVNREDDPRWTHAHIGWAADISAAHPGMEMLTNRDGHLAKETVMFGVGRQDPRGGISGAVPAGELDRRARCGTW